MLLVLEFSSPTPNFKGFKIPDNLNWILAEAMAGGYHFFPVKPKGTLIMLSEGQRGDFETMKTSHQVF